ncbi:MAG: hypothetical protein MJ094_00660 [Saccharofermentans sp.]|nr:hypothetical protein [Saccharofermentans sp.]
MSDNYSSNLSPKSPFRRPVGATTGTDIKPEKTEEKAAPVSSAFSRPSPLRNPSAPSPFKSSGASPFKSVSDSTSVASTTPVPTEKATSPVTPVPKMPSFASNAPSAPSVPTSKATPAAPAAPASTGLKGSSAGLSFGSKLPSGYALDEEDEGPTGGGIATSAGFQFTPMVTVADRKAQEASPFAPRVEKTEAQLREEEERARIAREKSVIEVPKKSRLDGLMDKLNSPIF